MCAEVAGTTFCVLALLFLVTDCLRVKESISSLGTATSGDLFACLLLLLDGPAVAVDAFRVLLAPSSRTVDALRFGDMIANEFSYCGESGPVIIESARRSQVIDDWRSHLAARCVDSFIMPIVCMRGSDCSHCSPRTTKATITASGDPQNANIQFKSQRQIHQNDDMQRIACRR